MFINLSHGQKTQHERILERSRKVSELRTVISSWDKKELKTYVYDNNKSHRCCDAGMAAVLERFINTNELQIGNLSEELKIGFDIVLFIARSTKISFETTQLLYAFIKNFEEVIKSYDRQCYQTYYHKLFQAYRQSIDMIEAKMKIEKELDVLNGNNDS